MQVRRTPLIAVAAICLATLMVPLLPLADSFGMSPAHHLASPSLAHPLGQDEYGRDALSRLLWGARGSLLIAVASALLAGLVGTGLGMIGGPMRRLAGFRGISVARHFPPLLLALLVITLRGPGMATLIPLFAIVFSLGFVSAPRDPRRLAEQLVRTTVYALILESGLSFLGLGVAPPELSWGLLIGDARATMGEAPLLLLWPCAALCLTILALNALADTLHEPAAFPEPSAVRRKAVPPPPTRPATGTAVLDVRNLTVEIDTPRGVLPAVRDVSFAVRAGETIALVGEGASLIGLAIVGLLPQGARASQGSAWLQGHNLLRLDDAGFRRVRGGVLSMVFSDPRSSLNPVHRVGAQITEVMRAHFEVAHYEAKEEAVALLNRVGIADAGRVARAYPHELTDDTLRRAMIAMAIANDPRLLIADEPAEDLFGLLADLRGELGMALVVISPNLRAVATIADRILVLQAGEIVEDGAASTVVASPVHPYTAALLRHPQGDSGARTDPPGGVPPTHELRSTRGPFAPLPDARYL
jgi:peptide/nickel transport system permease protein